MKSEIKFYGSGGTFALAILLIAFWGEPDLVDALIQYFTSRCS